jgi:hypothetical protein
MLMGGAVDPRKRFIQTHATAKRPAGKAVRKFGYLTYVVVGSRKVWHYPTFTVGVCVYSLVCLRSDIIRVK